MGQYYIVANKTKKQCLSPHVFEDGSKAWEIVANAGVLKALGYLLIKSDGGGGGDLQDNPFVGYWAGDEIIIVGDYDSSNLFDEAFTNYIDISFHLIIAILGENGGEFIYDPEIIKMMKERLEKEPPLIPFEQLSQAKRQIPVTIPQPELEPENLDLIDMIGNI